MASNAPPAAKGGLHKELFGLPLWSYALGVGAFAIAAFIYFRQGSSGASSQSSQQPAMPSGIPYPFPNYPGTPSGNVTSPVVNPNAGPQPAVQVVQGPGTILIAQGAQTGLEATPSTDQTVTWVPGGTPLISAGPPVQGKFPFNQPNDPLWGKSNWWQPVNYLDKTLYVWAPFALPSDLTQSSHVGQLVENFNNTATLPNTTNFATTPNVTTSNVFGASVNSGTVPAPLAPTAA